MTIQRIEIIYDANYIDHTLEGELKAIFEKYGLELVDSGYGLGQRDMIFEHESLKEKEGGEVREISQDNTA